jgi:hypothetical protein
VFASCRSPAAALADSAKILSGIVFRGLGFRVWGQKGSAVDAADDVHPNCMTFTVEDSSRRDKLHGIPAFGSSFKLQAGKLAQKAAETMAPAENHFQRLPPDLRKHIIYLSCAARANGFGLTLAKLRVVNKQFWNDCVFMRQLGLNILNDYDFLKEESAGDVEHLALEFASFGDTELETTACLMKALGETKGTLQSLYVGADGNLPEVKQDFLFHLLRKFPLLNKLALNLREREGGFKIVAKEWATGDFSNLRELTLREASLLAFPFEALTALSELSLLRVDIFRPVQVKSKSLARLTLEGVSDREIRVDAPNLQKIGLDTISASVFFQPLLRLEDLRISQTTSSRFDALPNRLLRLSFGGCTLYHMAYVLSKVETVRLLTFDPKLVKVVKVDGTEALAGGGGFEQGAEEGPGDARKRASDKLGSRCGRTEPGRAGA